MKSNTLVIATLAWTAGIVGCIDEHRASPEIASISTIPSQNNEHCALPVTQRQADLEQMEALARVPIFVGGDKVTEVKRSRKTVSPVIVASEASETKV